MENREQRNYDNSLHKDIDHSVGIIDAWKAAATRTMRVNILNTIDIYVRCNNMRCGDTVSENWVPHVGKSGFEKPHRIPCTPDPTRPFVSAAQFSFNAQS